MSNHEVQATTDATWALIVVHVGYDLSKWVHMQYGIYTKVDI